MGNDLTKEDLEILIMKEQYGMSYSAIANSLGISKTRVRQRYDRAKLRERESKMSDNPNDYTFKDYAMKNLETSTYNALRDAKIETYHDFIKLNEIDMLMLKGVGPAKVIELMKFKEKIIEYVKKGSRV